MKLNLTPKILLLILLLVTIFACSNNNVAKNNSFENREEYNLLRGMNLSQNGKYVEALKELQLVRDKNPKNILALRELGFVYGNLGEIESATNMYEEVLKIDSKDSVAIKNLAYIYYKNNELAQAEKYLDKISDKEDDYFTSKLKGMIFARQNKSELAYKYFSSANMMGENYDEEFFAEYLEIMLILEKKEESYKFLQNQAKKYYKERTFVLLYADALTNNFGEAEKSEKIMKKYLAENGSDDEILILLTKNLLGQNRKIDAEKSLKMVSVAGTHGAEYKFLIDETKK